MYIPVEMISSEGCISIARINGRIRPRTSS
jgi:hypothetical protein